MESNNSNSLIFISPIAIASSSNQSTTIDMDIRSKQREYTADEIREYARIVYTVNPLRQGYTDGGVSRSARLIEWLFDQPLNTEEIITLRETIQSFGKGFDANSAGHERVKLQRIFKAIELIWPPGQVKVGPLASIEIVNQICGYAETVYGGNKLKDVADGGIARSQELIKWLSEQDPNAVEVLQLQRRLKNFGDKFDKTKVQQVDYRRTFQKIFKAIEVLKKLIEAQANVILEEEDQAAPLGSENSASMEEEWDASLGGQNLASMEEEWVAPLEGENSASMKEDQAAPLGSENSASMEEEWDASLGGQNSASMEEEWVAPLEGENSASMKEDQAAPLEGENLASMEQKWAAAASNTNRDRVMAFPDAIRKMASKNPLGDNASLRGMFPSELAAAARENSRFDPDMVLATYRQQLVAAMADLGEDDDNAIDYLTEDDEMEED